MTQYPDRFSIDGGATFINATVGGLDPSNATYGDWEWDNANNEIKFMGKLLDYWCYDRKREEGLTLSVMGKSFSRQSFEILFPENRL